MRARSAITATLLLVFIVAASWAQSAAKGSDSNKGNQSRANLERRHFASGSFVRRAPKLRDRTGRYSPRFRLERVRPNYDTTGAARRHDFLAPIKRRASRWAHSHGALRLHHNQIEEVSRRPSCHCGRYGHQQQKGLRYRRSSSQRIRRPDAQYDGAASAGQRRLHAIRQH